MLIVTTLLGCGGSLATAEQGCVECSLRRHEPGATPPDAVARFETDCGAGDPASCSVLGVMYEVGRGVPQDRKRAKSLFQEACQHGNPTGCVNLGRLLDSGLGGRLDSDGAIVIFEVACHDGVGEGCYQLARMHYKSGSVGKARRALTHACDDGHPDACLGLGALHQHGHGVEPDGARASELYAKACRLGETMGCERLVALRRSARPQ
ncbi:MAG: sel1 repeat family protein [Deltaproteobacteria bacterium]|nr:sel1 repeat family protein [Deltaproteobacteria bacterium]